jgi:hypothetical protein
MTRSCRNCKLSTHSGNKLMCQMQVSPAYANHGHGVCSEASNSPSLNAGWDARCRILADICIHFDAEASAA